MAVNLKFYSIKTKLTLVNFFVLFLFSGFTFFLTMQSVISQLKEDLIEEVETNISFISQDLVRIIVFDSIDASSELTLRLRSFGKVNELVVYNKDKVGVFYYSKNNTDAINTSFETWVSDSGFVKNEYFSLKPLVYYKKTYGFISIKVSTDSIDSTIDNYSTQGIAYLFSFLIASIILTLLFNVLVSNPIRRLLSALKHISVTGDFSELITIKRHDEIGQLFYEFNEMQKAIQVACEELNNQKFALDEHAIVAVTNTKGEIIFANNKFSEISGYKESELLGNNHRMLNSGHHDHDFFIQLYNMINAGKVWHGEICNKTKGGDLYWVDTTIVPLLTPNGKPKGYISIHTNITELKLIYKKAAYLSQHDVLTGLPNRSQVTIHLDAAIKRSLLSNNAFALVFMDLNKFKAINDTFGHSVGDQVLVKIAQEFKRNLQQNDFIARHGGDEFVAIVEDISDVTQLDILLSNIISSIELPMMINNSQLYIGVSMGVSIYPTDANNEKDLFLHADIAMYDAKAKNGSSCQLYTEELNKKFMHQYKIESDLKKALKNNELFCVYQPKVDMVSGEVIGAEVLVRWKNEQGQYIPPSEFIPIAESCGLIGDIWDLILNESLECAIKLNKQSKKIPLAVNTSPLQFSNELFGLHIIERINDYALPFTALEIEITEGLLLDGNAKAKKILELLSEKGVKIAIDDFGTGYSSLKYLKDFPIDLVKMDISFISGIETNKDDQQLVKTMIDMSLGLGKKVIAEGVETEKQRDFLLENGCILSQGYLFSKPLMEDEFIRFTQH